MRHGGRVSDTALVGFLSLSSTGLVKGFTGLSIGGNTAESDTDDDAQRPLYCAACKKAFASPATLATHQQSEKHKKKEYQQQQNPKASRSLQQSQGQKIPKGALESLERARAIMHKDTAVAATVLWNIAKDIAKHDRSIVESVLRDALDCMQRMEADPKRRGSKGSPTAWSSRSLLKTMLECRLALARLLYTNGRTKSESANQYTLAVCQYLGIQENDITNSHTEHTPLTISRNAFGIAATIPRKFGKQEDIAQAIDAVDETANALLALSANGENGNDDSLAWRGFAFYFLMHAFALEKGNNTAAYRAIDQLITGFESLGMAYFGNECAMLIIKHHLQNHDALANVASAVMGSLLDSDLVRAKRLLEALNNSSSVQPWSHYMAELVAKRTMLDNVWMCQNAWAKWIEISSMLERSDPDVFVILNDGLDCVLSPYKWCYMPISSESFE
ncbi:hypothetical protein IW140_000833 [Coemansia sp. RSA 1813]|nr:hypothetical protein IW140_000833 [Coemansia sp. RSA 1813]